MTKKNRQPQHIDPFDQGPKLRIPDDPNETPKTVFGGSLRPWNGLEFYGLYLITYCGVMAWAGVSENVYGDGLEWVLGLQILGAVMGLVLFSQWLHTTHWWHQTVMHMAPMWFGMWPFVTAVNTLVNERGNAGPHSFMNILFLMLNLRYVGKKTALRYWRTATLLGVLLYLMLEGVSGFSTFFADLREGSLGFLIGDTIYLLLFFGLLQDPPHITRLQKGAQASVPCKTTLA